MTVLTATAGLLDELAFDLDRLADRFAVGHLRRTHIGFHAEFALHAVNQNFQMQFTHTGNDGLTGFFIGAHAERRIFLRQTIQRNAHLFLVDLGLRLDSHVNHRLREYHALQNDRLVRITQRIAGGRIFQTDRSGDIAGRILP